MSKGYLHFDSHVFAENYCGLLNQGHKLVMGWLSSSFMKHQVQLMWTKSDQVEGKEVGYPGFVINTQPTSILVCGGKPPTSIQYLAPPNHPFRCWCSVECVLVSVRKAELPSRQLNVPLIGWSISSMVMCVKLSLSAICSWQDDDYPSPR